MFTLTQLCPGKKAAGHVLLFYWLHLERECTLQLLPSGLPPLPGAKGEVSQDE